MTTVELDAALRGAAESASLLVAMDFDGTLSELVDVAADARPVDGAMDALIRLAELPATDVVLISGRAVADLLAVSGAPESIEVIGSHGAERGRRPAAAPGGYLGTALESAVAALQTLSEAIPGSSIERKPAGVVLHYRTVADDAVAALLAGATLVARDHPSLVVAHGKCVVELSAHAADKGQALRALRLETGADAVVFAGDDVTDEAAFAVLGPSDVGIKVGAGPSLGAHRLGGPAEVAAILSALADRRARRG